MSNSNYDNNYGQRTTEAVVIMIDLALGTDLEGIEMEEDFE